MLYIATCYIAAGKWLIKRNKPFTRQSPVILLGNILSIPFQSLTVKILLYLYCVWRGGGAGGEITFLTAVPDPAVHFTHQTLTISSFGYLLWRNKRHCYPFYYSKKKSQEEDLNSHPENKQCNAVLRVALPTAPRAVDGSKGGLTNLYLGLNHPRWIGCMQMSTRGLWLAVCKWVRTGVRNCSGINNLAGRGGGGGGGKLSLTVYVTVTHKWIKAFDYTTRVMWSHNDSHLYIQDNRLWSADSIHQKERTVRSGDWESKVSKHPLNWPNMKQNLPNCLQPSSDLIKI